MKFFYLPLIVSLVLPLVAQEAPPAGKPKAKTNYDAILLVENASFEPDYQTPWNGGQPSGGSGTGFLIGPNQILTNAHVVSNARRLTVRRFSNPHPVRARVVSIAHDCDLALLELEDPSFLKGITPLEFDGVPDLDTEVIVVGYPIGGERLSVTRGVVSRIDFQEYSHSGADQHMAIQIDAAINPGNSGGPVLQNGKVVGVAFQGYSGAVAQNVGYMIPVPVATRFLEDIKDGSYDHYVDLAISVFPLENPAQIKALGIPETGRGVFVSAVNSDGSAAGVIKPGDVMLEIDGKPIFSNGLIEVEGQQVDLNEIVERKFAGDKITIKVWRDRKELEVEVTLKRFLPYLINANIYDELPRYIMYAGLVFQPLESNLMQAHEIRDQAALYYYGYFVERELQKERPEPVIFTRILPDAINSHFRNFVSSVVDKVNGVTVKSLSHMNELLAQSKDDFVRIDFLDRDLPLVMERSRIESAQKRVMETYGIAEDTYLGQPK